MKTKIRRRFRLRGAFACLAVIALLATACGQPGPTGPASQTPAPSGSGAPADDLGVLPGEAPTAVKGPVLGESWTTEPDPESFIRLADGSRVFPDQYLVMLGRASTRADADRVAELVDGTVGGHIEYIGVWKILVAPVETEAEWQARLDYLAGQKGVLAAGAVALDVLQADPDCAPALSDKVYAGANSKPYDVIGVKAAWQAFYAAGVPVNPVHVGFLDSELTKDPKRAINWEFDDVTFIGDPGTTPDPRQPTGQDPTTDGFHHADGTLGIFAGDGQDGGIAGITSPLGSRVMVSHNVLNGPAVKGQPSKWTSYGGKTYTDDALLKTLKQIESGATIINGSWGASSTGNKNAGNAKMWKAFFDQMAKEHPDVLFVYAAGNYQTELTGTNYYPGGIASPNVITVGNIDTDGGRNSSSNGLLPGSAGEITLGAPGDKSVWGTGADGAVQASYGGTSSATPMVSATAALIRSIDPSLTAADIKKMIADSAATGDAEVGGKQLRVDLAVRQAIDGVRARQDPPMDPLTDEELADSLKYCQLGVTGELKERLPEPAGGTRWAILASLREARQQATLSLTVGGGRPTNWKQTVMSAEQKASWSVLAPKNGTTIVVTRHDNGYWVKYSLYDTALLSPSPSPTAEPSPTPTPAPSASASFDCSNPPPAGTIAYVKWSLHCKPIGV